MPRTRRPAEDECASSTRKPLPNGAASFEHYDRAETRSPAARENTLFRDLRAVLKIARPRAPALRAQLKGIDLEGVKTRADLAGIPLVRKSDLKTMQEDTPPFGGLAASRCASLKRLLVSPGPIFEPE
jgi:phenylacetate-CoA ligase